MNEDTFKLIAEQCGEYGAWVRISGGGEPMLHPKAIELVGYAKRVGAKVGLITNGSMFTEESIRRILEAEVDMVEFSVDACDPETYSRVRAGLKWEVLLENIKRMVEMRNNMGSKSKIIASGVDQRGVDIDAVARFWEPLVDNFQKRKYLDPFNPPQYPDPKNAPPCPYIFERLGIDSSGSVKVCDCDIAGKTNLGNVHGKSIKEIWRGKEIEYYRQMHLAHRGSHIALCKNCPDADWKHRSWEHNYWKIVKNAEERRKQRLERGQVLHDL